MNIKEQLDKVWAKDYINQLPDFVKERGFVYSINNSEKDILVTGINPSFRQDTDDLNSYGFDFQKTLKETKWDNYWGLLKRILIDADNNIDLKDRTAYLDIFYFREKEQKKLRNGILKKSNGIEFLVDQLVITQHSIEEIIKPKVIVVKNKESAAYWGKLSEQGFIWMGYQFEYLQSFNCGELYKISGLINSTERIAPDIDKTNLKGSIILFSEHISQYTKKEKRPTAVLINDLLEKYYKLKKEG